MKMFLPALIASFVVLLVGCQNPATGSPNPGTTTGATTGSIAGRAFFLGQTDNSGIVITAESLDGAGKTVSVSRSLSSRSLVGRAIVGQATTGPSGGYTLENLAVGTYTIYASSPSSLERAVYTGVSVVAGRAVTASDLSLTATGSVSGKVTLAGASTGNLGILVYLAGTSYSAMTKDDGSYTISGVPVGTGYLLVAGYSGYDNSAPANVTVAGGLTTSAAGLSLVKSASTTTTGSIAGTATMADKAANGNAGILVYLLGTSYLAISDASGAFNLSGVTPGSYTLVANKVGYADVSKSVVVTANGTAPAGNLALTIPSPSAIVATAGNASTTVSWAPVSGVTGYNLYWSTSASVTKASGTKVSGVTSPFVHTGLTNGTTYYYLLTTVSGAIESSVSGLSNATPQAAAVGAPAGLAVIGGDSLATVTWPAVQGAESYNLYWSPSNGVTPANGTKVAGVTSPAIVSGLANSSPYYFVLTAVISGVESPASSQVNATPQLTPPAAPATINALAGNAQATLTWPDVAGAVSYNLYWSTSTGVTKASGTKVTGVTSPYIQAGRSNGVTYYYGLTAVNAGGESVVSNQVSATPQVPAPAAPTVTVAAGNAQNTLTWPTVSGASSYNLYWSLSSAINTTTGTKVSGVSTPYTHPSLTNGTMYYYLVTAVNAGGESPASAVVSATPQVPICVAPTGLAVTPGNAQNSVSWSTDPNATSYNLYWSNSSTLSTANGTKVSNITLPYTHAGLTNNVPYYYILTSVNGAGESVASTQLIATPQVPNPVYSLTLVSTFNSPDTETLDLTWDGTNLWMVGGANDSYYKIDPATGNVLESHNCGQSVNDSLDYHGSTQTLSFIGNVPYIIAYYQTNWIVRELRVLDFSANTSSASFGIAIDGSRGMTSEGSTVWALNGQTSIVKIDSGSGNTLLTLSGPQADKNTGIALSNDKTQLYVGNYGTNKVYVVKKADGSVLGSASLPYAAPPSGYGLRGVCNDGTYLWLSDLNTRKIYKCQLVVQ